VNDGIVAGDDGHGAEFEAFGEGHGSDRNVVLRDEEVFVENVGRETDGFSGGQGAGELLLGTDEDSDFIERDAFGYAGVEPALDTGGFGGLVDGDIDLRGGAVEDGDSGLGIVSVTEEAAGLGEDLLGSAVIDS